MIKWGKIPSKLFLPALRKKTKKSTPFTPHPTGSPFYFWPIGHFPTPNTHHGIPAREGEQMWRLPAKWQLTVSPQDTHPWSCPPNQPQTKCFCQRHRSQLFKLGWWPFVMLSSEGENVAPHHLWIWNAQHENRSMLSSYFYIGNWSKQTRGGEARGKVYIFYISLETMRNNAKTNYCVSQFCPSNRITENTIASWNTHQYPTQHP